MNVFNMLGGSGGLKPQIVVTAPTGSTVTCDGIQGTEVSGTWTFNTTIGTHTIVATLSGQTATKSVVVDAIGRFEVEMSYEPNTTYIYYLGDQCTDVTGGWSKTLILDPESTWDTAAYQGSLESNYIDVSTARFSSVRNSKVYMCSNNMIDLNNYTGVALKTYTQSGSGSAYIGLKVTEGISTKTIGDTSRTASNGTYIGMKSFATLVNGYLYLYGTNWNSYKPTTYYYAAALYKSDDISGLSSYGSTIAEILANSSSLLSNESAVRTMINCTGEFMWSALSNSTWVTAYNSSPYKSLIDSNANWSKALALL